MGSPPVPLSSLRLLVPPLRLLTAAMWQVAQQQSVKHYGMLEDFVSLVTETVPQLLTDRQRSLLLLALRAKVTLSDLDSKTVSAHVERIHSVSEAKSDADFSEPCSALLTLTEKLSPADRRRLLQEVFNQSFDTALQSLISDFLSRIEQLFPVPDFKQAAYWLAAAPKGLENCLQEADGEGLKELLSNQSCSQGQPATTVTKLTNPDPVPIGAVAQSDPLPEAVNPVQLNVDMVKVEVVVMTQEKHEEVEEAMIGQTMSPVEQEASNESSAEGGEERSVTPVILEVFKLKESTGNSADQSDNTEVDLSDQSCFELTTNSLYNISHNAQRVAHKCPQCGKCYIYRSQVIRHLRTNKSCGSALTTIGMANQRTDGPVDDPRPPEPRLVVPRLPRTHSCFQCNAIFRTKAELRSHQRSHRARPVYQCGQCNREFHHLSSLTNHKQTHLDKGTFACSKCDKVFESAKERDDHRLQHRPAELTCTVCDKTFSSQTLLLRHLQTHSVEGAEPRYSCRYCDQTFSGVTQLRIHQRTHTSRSYQCDQCSKTYGSLTGLHSHQASHTTESRFLCPQCGKRFKTRDGMEGHLRRHTGERPYRCPYCPKDFTALAGLNVHIRRHTGERPYVCTVCGKGWPSGGDLQKHMRTHTGERPYVCQECGKAFSISCHLTEHRRIHTGEKPFSCPECGKCLRRKFDLKKHMLSHSNVRPYACVYCPKSYTRKTHLNRHLLTHRTLDSDVVEVVDE
ncbi:zinc finger protein 345-like isoform X2 [Channa argus]|uniref:zinc finger protein 345-like isoform X2 n=1 Tax=Channa argus TaxID=215402 RepID=UPI003520857A